MSSWEHQLITAILQRGEIRPALSMGVSPAAIGSIQARVCFDFLCGFAKDKRHRDQVPPESLIRERYPKFALTAPSMTLEALALKVLEDYIRRRTNDLLAEAAECIEEDPWGGLAALSDGARRLLEQQTHGDVDLGVAIEDVVKDYQEGVVQTGLPWPWPEVTHRIGPIEPGSLMVLYGIPKSGKSWLALLLCAHIYEEGHRVLMSSTEVRTKQMFRRLVMLLTRLNYERYRTGRLTESEQELLYTYSQVLQDETTDSSIWRRVLLTGIDRTAPVDFLHAKIEAYKPDVVLLDAAYGLVGIDWQKQAGLVQDLKALCTATDTVILVTTQESERAAHQYRGSRGTASVGGTAAWMQYCDYGIQAVNNDNGFLSVRFRALREAAPTGVRIRFSPATDFSYADDNVEEVKVPESTQEVARARTPLIRRPRGLL